MFGNERSFTPVTDSEVKKKEEASGLGITVMTFLTKMIIRLVNYSEKLWRIKASW
jgi:cytochrome c1